MINISEYKNKYSEAVGAFNSLQNQHTVKTKTIKTLKKRMGSIEKAQALIQKVAKETQEKIRFQIEDIVQLGIDSCFPNDYEFLLRFDTKRGRTEALPLLLRDDEPADPMTENGGGLVDVIAFALRIAAWSLSKTDNLIIFDEPFRFLSKSKFLRQKAAQIMKQLSHDLNLQIIMSTHIDELREIGDKVFEVEKNEKTKESSVTVFIPEPARDI